MPTPTPVVTETVIVDLSAWVGLWGTIFGALVALAGVIILFWLQQRAARKAERQRAHDAAFERLTENYMAVTATTDEAGFAAALNPFVMRVMEAVWFIDTRDDYLVDWIVTRMEKQVAALAAEPDRLKQRLILKSNYTGLVLVLRHWRSGTITRKNFDERVKTLAFNQPDGRSVA